MIERIVLISGTPGTGKTTVSKYINKNYDIQYLSLSDIVQKNNLYEAIDEERDTKIVDPDKLDDFIEDYIKNHEGDLIIDAHYADMVIHPAVKLGVILRSHPVELEKRLNARNYSEKKNWKIFKPKW